MIAMLPAVLIFSFLFFMYYLKRVKPFLRRRRYILMEMQRSNEKEYARWERTLKKLYKDNIPIIGPIRKRIRRYKRHKQRRKERQ